MPRGSGGSGSIDWRIIKLEATSSDGEEFKASQSLILAILKLSYKSTYLMSVAFRSIPYSTDGVCVCVPINVVYSITRKLSDSCRKTKHGEDKLDSLSQNIQKNAINTRTTTNSFYASYHFCSVIN